MHVPPDVFGRVVDAFSPHSRFTAQETRSRVEGSRFGKDYRYNQTENKTDHAAKKQDAVAPLSITVSN